MPQPKRKYNRKNDDYALLERHRQVAHLYIRGSTQWEIARQLGISQGTVSKYLATIREEWLKRTQEDAAVMVAQELAKLDHLEAEAFAAWERSKQPAKPKDKPKAGDPRFLERVGWAVDTRLRLLGAFKQPVGPTIVNQLSIEWDRMFERQPITDPFADDAREIEQRAMQARALPAPTRNGTHSRTPNHEED